MTQIRSEFCLNPLLHKSLSGKLRYGPQMASICSIQILYLRDLDVDTYNFASCTHFQFVPTSSCKIMQIRSRDLHRLKNLVLETATLFRNAFNISLLFLALFRLLKVKALRWDKIASGDWVQLKKPFIFSIKNIQKSQAHFCRCLHYTLS